MPRLTRVRIDCQRQPNRINAAKAITGLSVATDLVELVVSAVAVVKASAELAVTEPRELDGE